MFLSFPGINIFILFQVFLYQKLKRRVRKTDPKSSQLTVCPIKRMKSKSSCCERNCYLNQEHDCLLEKYLLEASATNRAQIIDEAMHQNMILKEQISILERLLDVTV